MQVDQIKEANNESSPDSPNAWDEPCGHGNNITFSSSDSQEVTAGTLNKLVEKLTSGESAGESTQYLDFMKTFLLTYQSFCTSQMFLQKLVERYHVPRQRDKISTFDDFDKLRLKVQLRVINVLQQWTKKHAFDFVDSNSFENAGLNEKDVEKRIEQANAKHELLNQLMHFAETVLIEDHPALGRQIRKNILRLVSSFLKCIGSYC
jgi:hypothetical protein